MDPADRVGAGRRVSWLLVALGIVGLVAAVVVGGDLVARRKASQRGRRPDTRQERESDEGHTSLAPVPQGTPLLGTPGTHPDGYPLQYVDRPGLRALLSARRFAELTGYFEQFQAAFEADSRKEYWPADAADAFQSAEPEIVADLDAWVAATPDSFAPYLARGTHYAQVTWARWGFGARPATEDVGPMNEAAGRALADLDRSIELRPRLVAAMRRELTLTNALSDPGHAPRTIGLALAACPACLQVRAAYLHWLISGPESYRAAQDFVATLSARDNPRFPSLAGLPDLDRAEKLVAHTEDPKLYATALGGVDRAIGYGEYWEYLYFRARTLRALKRFDEAVVMLDRADALRPMQPEVLVQRAALHSNRKEWVTAGRALLTALRIDPTQPDGKRYLTDVKEGLSSVARDSEAAGRHAEALEAVQLVLDLCADDERAQALKRKIEGR